VSYTALPDRRMPYDNDGTVVAYGDRLTATVDQAIAVGLSGYLTSGDRAQLNDVDLDSLTQLLDFGWSDGVARVLWWFFPETREVTAFAVGSNSAYDNAGYLVASGPAVQSPSLQRIDGSANSTNGVDGTWETASLPSGSAVGFHGNALDKWRSSIGAICFTGAKRVIRFAFLHGGGLGGGSTAITLAHIYGEKAAGQTPDDLIFIDHDTTPGAEYAAPEDFGDRPLGTSVVRQFRVKNASATLTANTINLQCNDADFAISTDNSTWVATINIASLAAGAESATMYVRNTTPAAGNALGPRFARIVAIVGSWT